MLLLQAEHEEHARFHERVDLGDDLGVQHRLRVIRVSCANRGCADVAVRKRHELDGVIGRTRIHPSMEHADAGEQAFQRTDQNTLPTGDTHIDRRGTAALQDLGAHELRVRGLERSLGHLVRRPLGERRAQVRDDVAQQLRDDRLEQELHGIRVGRLRVRARHAIDHRLTERVLAGNTLDAVRHRDMEQQMIHLLEDAEVHQGRRGMKMEMIVVRSHAERELGGEQVRIFAHGEKGLNERG